MGKTLVATRNMGDEIDFIESASTVRLYIAKSIFRGCPRHITAGPNSKEVLIGRVENAM
ncbi:unnamed protein product [Sphenostylis stenocarpa]|uniref:Uncharacterized protein n=1 Tax=Sphenostylis stenocarpa TaxID=92480 RepID=A0AA86T3J5_9FABA|nr:unnamed protein product [Sphenostylis stenocarpa]